MANQVFMIHALLDDSQRSQLLDAFPPRFPNIYCRHLVWAYGIPDDFVWPENQPLALTVIGHHVGDGHEALVCSVASDGQTVMMQALGNKLLHIGLSTADRVPPSAGGDIDPDKVHDVDPISLDITLIKGHARKLVAERRA
jgi:hypothetical protein